MAKLIMDGQEVEVKENSSLFEAGEQLGVYFGCQDGNCGVCDVEVVEGAENLTSITSKEKEFTMLKHHRLLCQCQIKKGTVKIRL